MPSLHIKIFKIDKFGDFSCDIDYNSRTDTVFASRAAQASEASLYIVKCRHLYYLKLNAYYIS